MTTNTPTDYDCGFVNGLTAAVSLGRAGASPDELALLLAEDPGQADPRGYSDHLSELRTILGTGLGIFGKDTCHEKTQADNIGG